MFRTSLIKTIKRNIPATGGRQRVAYFTSTSTSTSTSNVLLAVEKDNIRSTQVIETILQPLQQNEVRLKIEKFALTSNTVTYGKVGEKIGYFDFYPTKHESLRCVPAIGWAEVVESNVPGVPVGGRHFGWYPMSKYVTVEATPSKNGFKDIGIHRKSSAEVYTEHIRTDLDSFRDMTLADKNEDDYDDRQALLRGLFLTSFLADEFLADKSNYFDAKTIVLVSASSKTALGIAQRLSNKNEALELSQRLNIVGVTSAGNSSFVSSTGFYDQIVTYDAIEESISKDYDAVVIDMSGNWKVLSEIHQHLGERVKHSMAIGLSHHDSGFAPKSLVMPGAAPTFFFAPAEVARRLKMWGPKEFHIRSKAALTTFITGSQEWMDVNHVHGVTDVHREWLNAHDGKIPPTIGMIASMHDVE